MSQIRVSVVIPVYNGAERVPAVLHALALQDAADGSFEVIIVDNASTDGTAERIWRHLAAVELDKRSVPVRVVDEPRQGLTYARIRGALSASAPVLCFCDDDTVPVSDFVRKGAEAFADASVGLVVSYVEPKFEITPPPSVARRLWLFAATCQLGAEPFSFGAKATLAPTIGAGLWLRRKAFLEAVPWHHPEHLLHDRRGKQLTSGGDIEIGILIGASGYERMYRPELRLRHLIPAGRTRYHSVCALIAGITRSQLLLEQRYLGQTYTVGRRLVAAAKLLGVIIALPVLPLIRRDPVREAMFIVTRRLAFVRGPA